MRRVRASARARYRAASAEVAAVRRAVEFSAVDHGLHGAGRASARMYAADTAGLLHEP